MQDRTIVIADDEAHIRHVLSMKLQNAGFRVLMATDGEEALELCLHEPPALLITDYQMPVLSGIELCRRLRDDPRTQQVPCLMLTARGFDLVGDQADRTGIVAVMSKPFSPREVLEKVNAILSACTTEQGQS